MAAAKNPKRVAAGKKAWASRGKGKKRASSRRGKNRTKKRRIKGISGRVGAVILGVAPPAIAGVEAGMTAMAEGKARKWNGAGTFNYGFSRFLNNLSNGFGLGLIFSKEISVSKIDGGVEKHKPGSGIEAGALWKVAIAGGVLLAYDYVASKLAGGSGTKIPFTGIYATGNA